MAKINKRQLEVSMLNTFKDPATLSLTNDYTLIPGDIIFSSGINEGRKSILLATDARIVTLDNSFVDDDVQRFKTTGVGSITIVPASGVVINYEGKTTLEGVTISGDGTLGYIVKESNNSYRMYSDNLVGYDIPITNLYTEVSAVGANGGTGTGSWVAKSGGVFTSVSDADFTDGTAINVVGSGGQFDGIRLLLDDASVPSWSSVSTGLEISATYRITLKIKRMQLTAEPYYGIRVDNIQIDQGNATAVSTLDVQDFTVDFTVPAGGMIGTSTFEINADISGDFTDSFRFGDFSIIKL